MKEHRVNEGIKTREVLLIDSSGKKLGIKNREEALKIAEEQNLDLVEIAPTATPPICKIMDYDKFRYEISKKDKSAKKKQKIGTLKEIWIRPCTEKHDYEFKLNHIKRFLEHGHKVKITVKFRGREFTHQELGQQVLSKFLQDTKEIAVVESSPKPDTRGLIMILAPLKKK